MGKKSKPARSRYGMQVLTMCISTTLVLILLGLVVLSVQTGRNLSAYVRENLTVTVMLDDDMDQSRAKTFCRKLYQKPYTRKVDYISKEQAKAEQTAAMGSDPSEFLGFNPFVATAEIRLKSDYANSDSLRWIKAELLKVPNVTDVAYQEDLMNSVNANLRKAGLLLLSLAVLLAFVSFSLISNTVRLTVYSRRFLIHTMKLVGASWGFIRRPFMRMALGVGLTASVLACAVLAGGMYLIYSYEPGVANFVTVRELAVTGGSVLVFGLLITSFCSYLSVNRFLRMKACDLYNI